MNNLKKKKKTKSTMKEEKKSYEELNSWEIFIPFSKMPKKKLLVLKDLLLRSIESCALQEPGI